MKKLPYVLIFINDKYEYWPYIEAQEYCVYEIPKSSVIYLTDEELKEKEASLKEEK